MRSYCIDDYQRDLKALLRKVDGWAEEIGDENS